MNRSAFAFALLLLAVPDTDAAEVKLESLDAFDINVHKISVNIRIKDWSGCLPRKDGLKAAYVYSLEKHGFRVAPIEESHLEFAVSIVSLNISGPENCGLRVLSMARQIPLIKILRLSPGSTSTLFRLWTEDTLLTGKKSEMDSRVQVQAAQDAKAFYQVLKQPVN